jgi:hypothetical protein
LTLNASQFGQNFLASDHSSPSSCDRTYNNRYKYLFS